MNLDTKKLPTTIGQTRKARLIYYLMILMLLVIAYKFKDSVIIGLPSIALACIMLILIEFARIMNTLNIDKNHVTMRTGMIKTHSTTVYYDRITDIKISQNLIEMMLNYGNIYVNTPGHDEYEIVIGKMPNPHKIREFIEELKHKKGK